MIMPPYEQTPQAEKNKQSVKLLLIHQSVQDQLDLLFEEDEPYKSSQKTKRYPPQAIIKWTELEEHEYPQRHIKHIRHEVTEDIDLNMEIALIAGKIIQSVYESLTK